MPGLDGHAGRLRGIAGQGGVTLQPLRFADRQHAHGPAGALRQLGDQVAVAGIVAGPGQHGDGTCLRPALPQGAPGGMRGALHQLESGGAGGNQPGVQLAHLGGAV